MLFSVPADLPASHMASKGVDAFPLSQLLFRSAGLVLIPFSLFPPPASFFSRFYSTQVWRGFFALFGRSLRTSASIQYMLCENHSTRKFFFLYIFVGGQLHVPLLCHLDSSRTCTFSTHTFFVTIKRDKPVLLMPVSNMCVAMAGRALQCIFS